MCVRYSQTLPVVCRPIAGLVRNRRIRQTLSVEFGRPARPDKTAASAEY
jgi:hypothetical protein